MYSFLKKELLTFFKGVANQVPTDVVLAHIKKSAPKGMTRVWHMVNVT